MQLLPYSLLQPLPSNDSRIQIIPPGGLYIYARSWGWGCSTISTTHVRPTTISTNMCTSLESVGRMGTQLNCVVLRHVLVLDLDLPLVLYSMWTTWTTWYSLYRIKEYEFGLTLTYKSIRKWLLVEDSRERIFPFKMTIQMIFGGGIQEYNSLSLVNTQNETYKICDFISGILEKLNTFRIPQSSTICLVIVQIKLL